MYKGNDLKIWNMSLLILTKESLGRAMRISGHLNRMKEPCGSCEVSLVSDIIKENEQILDRLEMIIKMIERGKQNGP